MFPTVGTLIGTELKALVTAMSSSRLHPYSFSPVVLQRADVCVPMMFIQWLTRSACTLVLAEPETRGHGNKQQKRSKANIMMRVKVAINGMSHNTFSNVPFSCPNSFSVVSFAVYATRTR